MPNPVNISEISAYRYERSPVTIQNAIYYTRLKYLQACIPSLQYKKNIVSIKM